MDFDLVGGKAALDQGRGKGLRIAELGLADRMVLVMGIPSIINCMIIAGN